MLSPHNGQLESSTNRLSERVLEVAGLQPQNTKTNRTAEGQLAGARNFIDLLSNGCQYSVCFYN